MQILNPIPVPWQMVATCGWIELTSPENGPHTVRIGANLLLESEKTERTDGDKDDHDSAPPSSSTPRFEEHIVRVTFPGRCWIRRSAPTPTGDPICESDYQLPCIWQSASGLDFSTDRFKHFEAVWQETGLCPDPRVYIVGNSEWDIGPDKERLKLQHFLFYGDNSVLEILAPSFSWMSEGRRGW